MDGAAQLLHTDAKLLMCGEIHVCVTANTWKHDTQVDDESSHRYWPLHRA